MQIRLFRGSGEPVWVNAPSSARFCLGLDPRRALGPAATPAASTGRTRDRTRPMLQNVRKFLPWGRPHVTQSGHPIRIYSLLAEWFRADIVRSLREACSAGPNATSRVHHAN